MNQTHPDLIEPLRVSPIYISFPAHDLHLRVHPYGNQILIKVDVADC